MRLKHLLTILALFLSFTTHIQAHDGNHATFNIKQTDNMQWQYEVMAPLFALDQSMKKSNPEVKFEELATTSNEYKEKLVAHIKEGFNVTATSTDNESKSVTKQPSLGKGRIKLDDHLSILLFEIKDMPEKPQKLDIQINNMSDNEQQTNLVRLIKGKQQKRYMLNAENDFKATNEGFFVNSEEEAEKIESASK